MAADQLALLSKAKSMLAKCVSVDEAKGIRDKAAAIAAYRKQQSESFDSILHATEIKLRAERRMGQLLAGMELHGSNQHKRRLPDATSSLSDLGISKSQSHRWQTEAEVPEKTFEQFIDLCRSREIEPTSKLLYAAGKKLKAQKPIEPADDSLSVIYPEQGRTVGSLSELSGEKFGCIYADPPWQYGNQSTRASTDNHYGTMSLDALCEMPIAELAADAAHLHLWTTNGFLFDAKRVMEAWGFEYRSCFVWVKPQMGIGNYWRVSHEFLLLGIRGNAKRFNNRSLISWGEFPRGEHSEKPDAVRGFIEMASPGPYLELFGREAFDGWTVFGNQINPQRKLA